MILETRRSSSIEPSFPTQSIIGLSIFIGDERDFRSRLQVKRIAINRLSFAGQRQPRERTVPIPALSVGRWIEGAFSIAITDVRNARVGAPPLYERSARYLNLAIRNLCCQKVRACSRFPFPSKNFFISGVPKERQAIGSLVADLCAVLAAIGDGRLLDDPVKSFFRASFEFRPVSPV